MDWGSTNDDPEVLTHKRYKERRTLREGSFTDKGGSQAYQTPNGAKGWWVSRGDIYLIPLGSQVWSRVRGGREDGLRGKRNWCQEKKGAVMKRRAEWGG